MIKRLMTKFRLRHDIDAIYRARAAHAVLTSPEFQAQVKSFAAAMRRIAQATTVTIEDAARAMRRFDEATKAASQKPRRTRPRPPR